jgi:hypothetical protein
MEPAEPTALDFEGLTPQFIHEYKHRGAKGLRACLAEYVATGICSRGRLQESASELAAMKLAKQGKLVAKAALRCPPMTDPRFCTYESPPSDPKIMAHWQRRQQYRADKVRRRIEQLLRQAGLDWSWLGEAETELPQSGELKELSSGER